MLLYEKDTTLSSYFLLPQHPNIDQRVFHLHTDGDDMWSETRTRLQH